MKQDSKNPKTKSDLEVIGMNYFFERFEKEKRKYPPSFFCTDKKVKAKRRVPVGKRLFRKIVIEYLKLYFYDLYMGTKSMYFPLGGFMKKVRYKSWVNYQSRGTKPKELIRSDGAIGLFWYMRPTARLYFMVQIKKLTGSTNRIPKIEKIFLDNFNRDNLPTFIDELRKAEKSKNLYLCTRT